MQLTRTARNKRGAAVVWRRVRASICRIDQEFPLMKSKINAINAVLLTSLAMSVSAVAAASPNPSKEAPTSPSKNAKDTKKDAKKSAKASSSHAKKPASKTTDKKAK
jgi:hypothetical protein